MLTVSRSAAPYHHGDLAAALEAAAIELLADRSPSAVSLREVARRAGVSHNAPYHHFGDRQGLLKAVAARSLRDLLAAMRVAREGAESPRERLLAIGRAYVDFAIDHAGQFGVIFDPEICDPRDPNPVTAPLIAANDEFLADSVREVLPPATSDDVVRSTAAGLWATVHGLAALVSAGHLERDVVPPALESVLGEPAVAAMP